VKTEKQKYIRFADWAPQETSLDKGVWQTTQPDKIPKFQTSATAPNTNISDNALCFYYLYEDKIKKTERFSRTYNLGRSRICGKKMVECHKQTKTNSNPSRQVWLIETRYPCTSQFKENMNMIDLDFQQLNCGLINTNREWKIENIYKKIDMPRVKRRTERLSCCWDGWRSESCALTLTVSRRRWRGPVDARAMEKSGFNGAGIWEPGRIGLGRGLRELMEEIAISLLSSQFSLLTEAEDGLAK
jgi:hypothetical protein